MRHPVFYLLFATHVLPIGFAHKMECTSQQHFERIDTHSHFVPPIYRNASIAAGYGQPDGMPTIPAWTEQDHLDFMDKVNITKSIVSITSPGTHLTPGDNVSARQLSRQCNEFAADLKRRHPTKFGFWASLPLPDVDGSLVELAYALDHLDADGVAVMTNAHGVYLGDAVLEPVFEELNRRNATVFIHPTSPCIGGHGEVQRAAPLTTYPNPMFEFFFDTARAVINMFLSETVKNNSQVTFIVSHAGGALPPMIERFTNFATSILQLPVQINSDTVKAAFENQFYFDLAGFVFPDQVYGLLRYVNASRIVYGSDYPYTPASGAQQLAQVMNEEMVKVFPDEGDREGIYIKNAEGLLENERNS